MLLRQKLYNQTFDVVAAARDLLFQQMLEIIFDTFVGAPCSDASRAQIRLRRCKFQLHIVAMHIDIHELLDEIDANNVFGEL